jgi:hypothetical protein
VLRRSSAFKIVQDRTEAIRYLAIHHFLVENSCHA